MQTKNHKCETALLNALLSYFKPHKSALEKMRAGYKLATALETWVAYLGSAEDLRQLTPQLALDTLDRFLNLERND